MPRVHVIGPVSWNLLVHVPELPEPRPHTVFAERHHETLGGTSAGKALNLRRLGVDVTLSTLLGDDAAGERVLRELRGAGVQVLARRSTEGTERHANLMDARGRRLSVYLTLPEAAPDTTGECRERQRAAIAAADVVVADLADHTRAALPAARAAGKEVWCDLHDYDGSSTFHEEFLAAADVVFLSDERLADPEAFVRAQVAAGKRLVVCTQGARGALAAERGGELRHVPAAEVPEVVDTNGAGDAFFAGFLAASLDGAGLEECLHRATLSAAACLASWELAGAPPAAGESQGLVPA
ncbi:sugar/nucleoside kinase (ribokinase family) [Kineococcus xinjiangensis]|uniref:Sugar/nucleoside kinase (Ribokinase family) n=1 Tax=Kineococcus xinjiangensis TaxID=512762 RepID=A0A2S6IF95_9ACTN|nr:carbohydrate kinase family protein [Kineococcus xinjiangensis]PPK92892.1 sugar/nucleoside kinase (ribokinase family) [Kineococcus xinjiangensis]